MQQNSSNKNINDAQNPYQPILPPQSAYSPPPSVIMTNDQQQPYQAQPNQAYQQNQLIAPPSQIPPPGYSYTPPPPPAQQPTYYNPNGGYNQIPSPPMPPPQPVMYPVVYNVQREIPGPRNVRRGFRMTRRRRATIWGVIIALFIIFWIILATYFWV